MYNQIKYLRKEVNTVPNLKHLLEELEELDVHPRQIKLPGPLYDGLLDQAEDIEEENEEENEQ